MGVNLIGLHSLPGPPGASGLRVRPSGSPGCRGSPSGSSGRPGRRSTPSHQDLIVITYKHKDQSARMHKSAQIISNSQKNLFYWVDHDFRRIMKLVSYFSEIQLIY